MQGHLIFLIIVLTLFATAIVDSQIIVVASGAKAPSTDKQAPTIQIVKPLDGSTVSAGTISVEGKAADNRGGSGINNVQVHIDNGAFTIAKPKATGDWTSWSLSTMMLTVGSHTIEAKATDKAGNTKLHAITLTTIDNSPPTIGLLSDVMVEATGPTTVVILDPPQAQDQVDPSPSIVNNAPPAFPIGTTIVTWIAQDFSGNTATANQVIKVQDTTQPSIIAPSDKSSFVTGIKTIIDLGMPMVTDIADPMPLVVNDAPSDGFMLGDTIVTWTATDNQGNSNSATQLITIMEQPNDIFGVKKIYPTSPDWIQWSMNEDDVLNDPSFSAIPSANSTCTSPTSCTLMYKNNDNTTWHARRIDVPLNEGIRLVVKSGQNSLWLNTEMTGYYRLMSSTYYPQEFIHVLRSGSPHSSTCEGYSYYAGITYDGNIAKVQKSLYHGADRLGYSQTIYSKGITSPLNDRWIGMKTVLYNIDNNSAIKIEIWLDDLANNVWHKVFEQVDAGWNITGDPSNFGCINPLTGQLRSGNDVILWGGTEQQFRADNAEMDFKWLSIREIIATDNT